MNINLMYLREYPIKIKKCEKHEFHETCKQMKKLVWSVEVIKKVG